MSTANAEAKSSGWKTVHLFGGAFEVTVPNDFTDMSDYRDIPNNQEVYANQYDQSIIIELNEMVSNPDAEAARYHYDELVKASGAESPSITAETELSQDAFPSLSSTSITHLSMVDGTAKVGKYRETDPTNVIRMHMTLLRLPRATTDILIIINSPVSVSSTSAAATADSIENDGQPSVEEITDKIRASFKLCSMTIFFGPEAD